MITGLLHFAYASPSNDLARKGLIAFALLARELFKQKTESAIAAAVAERAEEQLTLRLDEHTTRMETQVEEAVGELEKVRQEMDRCTGRLKEACDWVSQAEAALTAARTDLQVAGAAAQPIGTSQLPPSAPTLESAPARTRRAVTLAELLQRQVLVRGASIEPPTDRPFTDAYVLEEARRALDKIDRGGLTAPKDGALEAAKRLPQGDIVFTTSSTAMAKWLMGPNVATVFSRTLGLKAHMVERTYKLVAERVPVEFDPSDPTALRAIEEAHGLSKGAIARADWIKPPEKRFEGQRTAFLMLTVTGVQQANTALKGLTIAGRLVLVRRDFDEPKRCAKCQSYEGHFAKDCPAQQDTCANCAGPHQTARCSMVDPAQRRCANCNMDGHAAWDRDCPTLRARVRSISLRRADSGFRFFVTNNPETWVSDDEELARAPPPPTVWSQIRHRFDLDDAARVGSQQPRLDRFFPPSAPAPSSGSS